MQRQNSVRKVTNILLNVDENPFSITLNSLVFFLFFFFLLRKGGRGAVSQAAIVTAPLVPLPLTYMINCWTLLRTCWDRRIGIGRFKPPKLCSELNRSETFYQENDINPLNPKIKM